MDGSTNQTPSFSPKVGLKNYALENETEVSGEKTSSSETIRDIASDTFREQQKIDGTGEKSPIRRASTTPKSPVLSSETFEKAVNPPPSSLRATPTHKQTQLAKTCVRDFQALLAEFDLNMNPDMMKDFKKAIDKYFGYYNESETLNKLIAIYTGSNDTSEISLSVAMIAELLKKQTSFSSDSPLFGQLGKLSQLCKELDSSKVGKHFQDEIYEIRRIGNTISPDTLAFERAMTPLLEKFRVNSMSQPVFALALKQFISKLPHDNVISITNQLTTYFSQKSIDQGKYQFCLHIMYALVEHMKKGGASSLCGKLQVLQQFANHADTLTYHATDAYAPLLKNLQTEISSLINLETFHRALGSDQKQLTPLFESFKQDQLSQHAFEKGLKEFVSKLPRDKVAPTIDQLTLLFKKDSDDKQCQFCFRVMESMVAHMGWSAASPLLGQSEKVQKFSNLTENSQRAAAMNNTYGSRLQEFRKNIKDIPKEFLALEAFYMKTISDRYKKLGQLGLMNAVKGTSFVPSSAPSSTFVYRNPFRVTKEVDPKQLDNSKLQRLLNDLDAQGEVYGAAEVLLLVFERSVAPSSSLYLRAAAHVGTLLAKSKTLFEEKNEKESLKHYEIAKNLIIAYDMSLSTLVKNSNTVADDDIEPKTIQELLQENGLTFTHGTEPTKELDFSSMKSSELSTHIQKLIKNGQYTAAANALVKGKGNFSRQAKLLDQAQIVANHLLEESGELVSQNKILQASSHLTSAKELLTAFGDDGAREFTRKIPNKKTVTLSLQEKVTRIDDALHSWMCQNIKEKFPETLPLITLPEKKSSLSKSESDSEVSESMALDASSSSKEETIVEELPKPIFIGNLLDVQEDISSTKADIVDTLDSLIGNYLKDDPDLSKLENWVKNQNWDQSIEKAENNHIALFRFVNAVAKRNPELIPDLQKIVTASKITPEKILVADLESGWHSSQIKTMASLYHTWHDSLSTSISTHITQHLDAISNLDSKGPNFRESVEKIASYFYVKDNSGNIILDKQKFKELLSMQDRLNPERQIASFVLVLHFINKFDVKDKTFGEKGPFYGALGDFKEYLNKAIASPHIKKFSANTGTIQDLASRVATEFRIAHLSPTEVVDAILAGPEKGSLLAVRYLEAMNKDSHTALFQELSNKIDKNLSLAQIGHIIRFLTSLDKSVDIASTHDLLQQFQSIFNKIHITQFTWIDEDIAKKSDSRIRILETLEKSLQNCIANAGKALPSFSPPPSNRGLKDAFERLIKGEKLSEEERRPLQEAMVRGLRDEYTFYTQRIKISEIHNQQGANYAAITKLGEQFENLLIKLLISATLSGENPGEIYAENINFCYDLAKALVKDGNFSAEAQLCARLGIYAPPENYPDTFIKAFMENPTNLTTAETEYGGSSPSIHSPFWLEKSIQVSNDPLIKSEKSIDSRVLIKGSSPYGTGGQKFNEDKEKLAPLTSQPSQNNFYLSSLSSSKELDLSNDQDITNIKVAIKPQLLREQENLATVISALTSVNSNDSGKKLDLEHGKTVTKNTHSNEVDEKDIAVFNHILAAIQLQGLQALARKDEKLADQAISAYLLFSSNKNPKIQAFCSTPSEEMRKAEAALIHACTTPEMVIGLMVTLQGIPLHERTSPILRSKIYSATITAKNAPGFQYFYKTLQDMGPPLSDEESLVMTIKEETLTNPKAIITCSNLLENKPGILSDKNFLALVKFIDDSSTAKPSFNFITKVFARTAAITSNFHQFHEIYQFLEKRDAFKLENRDLLGDDIDFIKNKKSGFDAIENMSEAINSGFEKLKELPISYGRDRFAQELYGKPFASLELVEQHTLLRIVEKKETQSPDKATLHEEWSTSFAEEKRIIQTIEKQVEDTLQQEKDPRQVAMKAQKYIYGSKSADLATKAMLYSHYEEAIKKHQLSMPIKTTAEIASKKEEVKPTVDQKRDDAVKTATPRGVLKEERHYHVVLNEVKKLEPSLADNSNFQSFLRKKINETKDFITMGTKPAKTWIDEFKTVQATAKEKIALAEKKVVQNFTKIINNWMNKNESNTDAPTIYAIIRSALIRTKNTLVKENPQKLEELFKVAFFNCKKIRESKANDYKLIFNKIQEKYETFTKNPKFLQFLRENIYNTDVDETKLTLWTVSPKAAIDEFEEKSKGSG